MMRLALLLAVSVLPPGSSSAAEAAPKKAAAFSGRYYGMAGRVLHTWDFNPDGTFYHAAIVSGAGTSARSGERGRFELAGNVLILHAQKAASGFVAPGVGGRTSQIGGGAQAKDEVRRLSFQRAGDGVVLGGVPLKVKSW